MFEHPGVQGQSPVMVALDVFEDGEIGEANDHMFLGSRVRTDGDGFVDQFSGLGSVAVEELDCAKGVQSRGRADWVIESLPSSPGRARRIHAHD